MTKRVRGVDGVNRGIDMRSSYRPRMDEKHGLPPNRTRDISPISRVLHASFGSLPLSLPQLLHEMSGNFS